MTEIDKDATAASTDSETSDHVDGCPAGHTTAPDPINRTPRSRPAIDPPLVSGGHPLIGHITQYVRDPDAFVIRGCREHGRIFRAKLGPGRTIILLGQENNRFFFSETDRRLTLQQAYPFMRHLFSPGFWFEASHEQYLRQRAIVLPRFQRDTVRTYLDDMVAEIRLLEQRLGAHGEFDLVDTLGPLVLRITGRAFLSKTFAAELLDRDFFKQIHRFSGGMEFVLPNWLPAPHLIKSRRAKQELHESIGAFINQRRRQPVNPPDFLQNLLEATYESGERPDTPTLINFILLFVSAGQETTTGHLSWGFIDLLQHPDALARATEEAHRVLDGVEDISHEHVRRLGFIDRALHETERTRPVMFVMRRRALEDFEHAGFQFRAGDRLMIAPPVSHRLPDEFPDPDRYHPDRFLEQPNAKKSLVGFGGGLHRCLGATFAYTEMAVTIGMLLRDYDLELIDKDPKPLLGMRPRWPNSPCRVRYTRKS